MSSNNPNQTIRSPEKPESKFEDEAEDEEEAEELEQLETQVKQMAKKILEYRVTLPDQLKTTLALLLSSQRPILPDCDSGSDPGPSGELNPALGQWMCRLQAVLNYIEQCTVVLSALAFFFQSRGNNF
ncbi:hypothetical protein POPTR_002G159100v4 [Populus trichocarpa]|uniref:Uncharacterized protein n=2 Tax=Populus trichocarpa TaxID=3694 RepID=A0ACC0TEN6_POPTR|nr:hypothetical protein POPTR_002G159100v4 [Populus trichocarpa]KAI9399858.1 hypothetical protein POPTR_002G159100v4 [Populus trichocarpa]